jgi:L-iditol 2-dehydrogenase
VAAQQAGAGQVIVTDVFPNRLQAARRLGATAAVDVRAENTRQVVESLTDGRGAEALLDTSGNRAVLETAPDLMRAGGFIAVIGLPADDRVTYRMNSVVDKEVAIRGVFRYANTYPAGIQIVGSERFPLDAIITHRLPLAQVPHAFDLLVNHKDQVIKVMIEA